MHQSFERKNSNATRYCVQLFSGLLFVVAGALWSPAAAWALPVQFGLGPDNNHSLLLSHIRSARESLTINIYMFDQPAIADAILDRIDAGVTVKILIEGTPFGSVSASGKKIISAISSAMARSRNHGNHLFMMVKTDPSTKRRYRYDHAKYVVVDGLRSLISSENFTETGHAVPGRLGNRGWDTIVDDSDISGQLEDIFAQDTVEKYSDIREIPLNEGDETLPRAKPGKVRNIKPFAQGSGQASRATLITSPESLDGIVRVLRSARKSISIQHMGLPSTWKSAPNAGQNPIVTELIRAAERGVQVRVLLNDESVFTRTPKRGSGTTDPNDPDSDNADLRPNEITANLLNSVAKNEHLALAAQIIDIEAMGVTYLHNKGMVVDGVRAMVSSINGSQTSVMKNREVAVLLESPDAAAYYGAAFDFDWAASNQDCKGPAKFARGCGTRFMSLGWGSEPFGLE